jgi:serine/threonine-protein kinase
MREAGRALALDPNQPTAAAVVARLLFEPPEDLPAEVAADLVKLDNNTVLTAGIFGALAYGSWILLLPLYLWAGVRDWATLGFILGCAAIAVTVCLYGAWRRMPNRALLYAGLIFSDLAIAASSRIAGPLVIVPMLAVVNGLAPIVVRPSDPTPWFTKIGLALAALFGPPLLEWAGLLDPSYAFHGGAIAVVPHMLRLDPAPVWCAFVLISLGAMLAPGMLLERTRRELVVTQRRVAVQAWHLRRLIPDAPPAGASAARPSARSSRPPPAAPPAASR